MTSARILDEDACHLARNLCVFSHVQKGTPGWTHEGGVLQRVSLGAFSDVTVVLGMRQSIDKQECSQPIECVASSKSKPDVKLDIAERLKTILGLVLSLEKNISVDYRY